MTPNEEIVSVNKTVDVCQINLNSTHSPSDTSIVWQNLGYEVNDFSGWKWKKKPILQQLNGHFNFGSLNGLLGPSGAGKTTLLNCLSGTVHSGLSDNTEIYLNFKHGKSTASYYIRQHVHESIPGKLTVGQILRYAFEFKNGIGKSKKMRQHITATMAALMLTPVLESRPFDLCSGGEQKRVAIAQELMALTAPSFLFLDEPTTGLDSAAAYEVIHCLQQLARSQNITIIASIHSPNDETLNLFDQLYVLAKGGVCIFSGPPNQIKAQLKQENICLGSDDQPPIEALLKIACKGLEDRKLLKLTTNCITNKLPSLTNLTLQPNGFPSPRKSFSIVNLYLQICRLFRIMFLCNLRQVGFTILQYLFIYTIFGTIYNHQSAAANVCYPNDPSQSNITCAQDLEETRLANQNNTFHIYNFILVSILITCTSAIIFSPIVKILQNEHQNYWYSLGVFYWSSTIISFLEVTFQAFLITTFAYFLTFQHSADDYSFNSIRFGSYLFFIWLLCIYMQSTGQLIGAILMNYSELAIIVCQVICILMTVVNDTFVDTEKTGNAVLIQFANIVALKYITKGLVYTFYGIDKCDSEKEFSSFILRYHVDKNMLLNYVVRVVINIVILRMVTLIFLYIKFNTFADHPIVRLLKRRKTKKTTESGNITETIAIDFNNDRISKYSDITANSQIDGRKSKEEMAFNSFSDNKFIIGWRHLTLFGTSSIFEIGGKRDKKVQPKMILCDLNGQFEFGSLNALMGTSGAGKTSMLKVLNGRCKTRLGDQTEIYLSKFTKINTCFITQEVSGHLMLGLTAKQMLIYASMMKNAGIANVNHELIAIKWLEELDLMKTINTKIEHCSGGEQKRLAVALELTAVEMPNLICIDEPTSGLDTNSAEIVISTLRKLTQSHPMTIITTIHQPTIEVLHMFDKLYVLARGGVCIYSGLPNKIQAHLNSLTQTSPHSQYAIENIIKYSCSDHKHPTIKQLAQLTTDQILDTTESLLNSTYLVPDGVTQNRPRFSFYSVYVLSRRYLSHVCGNLWPQLLAFAIVNIIYAFQLKLFFLPKIAIPSGCIDLDDDFNSKVCHKSSETILEEFEPYENYKYNFFVLIIFLFFLMLQSSLIFGKEFVYFINEHRNGWYSSGSFYMMKSLFEMLPMPFIIIVYVYLCDIYSVILPGIYWKLVALLILGTFAVQGMAHTFSLLSGGNNKILTIISVSMFFLFCQISNLIVPLAQLHYIYKFLANFSISRFTFESALLLEYGFGRCGKKQVQVILYTMSIDDGHLAHCVLMLIFNLVLYRVIALYLLISKANPLQNRKQRVARIEKYQQAIKSFRFG